MSIHVRAQEAWEELTNSGETELVEFPTNVHDGFIAGYKAACKDFVDSTTAVNHQGENAEPRLYEAVFHPLAQRSTPSVATHRLLAVDNTYYNELTEHAEND